ncbi:DNA/RNA non-specific endonuclease [Paenibacillus sp. SYP-B3998]|uniref:DNA/RNA non-specific endonuclease n=2 Tax=Paenibacillus sp. SYP-B3998 TaxID=2678564 RepID=A0A6G4A5V1_9BACL|nr:DNA/RNA non-specific endonuclease [Paenibacillus sp. SYP-B3998]
MLTPNKTLSEALQDAKDGVLKFLKNDDEVGKGTTKAPKPSKPPETKGTPEAPNKTFVDNPFDEAGKLKPNVKYKAGEHQYDYETDHLGRIENFSTDDLKLTTRDERLPHDANTPGKESGDHAGHLAGDRFGGSPEIDNLVSQSSKVNLSTYKKIENEWARVLQAKPPKHVTVDVKIKYDGDSLRPSSF